ncbi:MAG: hypothetical protein ACKVOK_10585 [Flavobacteriales bacterium]
MSKNIKWKKYIALVGMLFLFPLVFLLFFGKMGKHNFKTLPYFGIESPNEQTHSDYTIPGFVFSDQNGNAFTRDSLVGNVWLAAFYSLNDPHLDKITERILNLNFRYRDEKDIRIVTFCTDCDYDALPLVQNYTHQLNRYNCRQDKWVYLTGNQAAMQSFIRNGFLIQDLKNEAIFRLVDESGHIRGLYGNTEYHMLNAMEDVALLKKEIDIRKYNEKKAREKGVQ